MVDGGGDLLERLGPDLSTAVFMCLEDPADLVRLATVSHSWRRFVIANGLCKMLCLRVTPQISCFVRVIEVGDLSNNLEIGSNFSVQWQMLESEHRIYAYLGYCIVTPRFLQVSILESIAISRNANRMKIAPNNTGPNVLSSSSTSKDSSLITFRLNSKFCVVYEIRVQPGLEMLCNGTPVYESKTLRFRLGHMMDENANHEESLMGNYIWAYVSPELSVAQIGNVQSIKLPRPVICVCGILQIELFTGVQKNPANMFSYISAFQIEAILLSLVPSFDVSVLDRTGNSVLMYFPGGVDCCRFPYSRNKLINTKKRRNRRYHGSQH